MIGFRALFPSLTPSNEEGVFGNPMDKYSFFAGKVMAHKLINPMDKRIAAEVKRLKLNYEALMIGHQALK